jgi:hypothetical protein
LGIGLLAAATTCFADVFIDPTSSVSGLNDELYAPIGQSFTANVSAITWIGMFTSICGCAGDGYAPVEFQLDLLSGSGESGPIIATETADAPWGLDGFLYFDFSGTDLVVGDTYTAVLFQITPSPPPMGSGASIYEGVDDYSGGEAFWGSPYSIGPAEPQPGHDFLLQVLSTPQYPGQPSPVPEPRSYVVLTLVVLGFSIVKQAPPQPRST